MGSPPAESGQRDLPRRLDELRRGPRIVVADEQLLVDLEASESVDLHRFRADGDAVADPWTSTDPYLRT